jgi:shikimate dehydrogenase
MKKFAVLGNPIKHSKSTFIHKEFSKETNIELIYDFMLCPLEGFVQCVDNFRDNGGIGLNITVPFKEHAYAYATELTERAKRAKAVNTLKFFEDGKVIGDNTDGDGLVWDIKRLGWDLVDKDILIIGAGGASRGIIGPILDLCPKSICLVNRTFEKAKLIQEDYPSISVGTLESTYETENKYDVVINATSLSLSNNVPTISEKIFKSNTCCYDLMYTPSGETSFLKWCVDHGVSENNVSDGLGMLVGQAALSFQLWHGVLPTGKDIIAKVRALV